MKSKCKHCSSDRNTYQISKNHEILTQNTKSAQLGIEIDEKILYCTQCGFLLNDQEIKICPQCGSSIS